MIVLSCKDVCKSYGINEVLKNITFSINEGDKVGIIGSNGEGKSTLFKILTKEISYDDGEIFIDKNKTLGYLSQHLSLDSCNSIYDEMLLVFDDLQKLEKKISDLEIKMNEPYDVNNAEYHEKIIKDYGTAQDLYENRGGFTYKGEISRVIKGLGFTENDFDKIISTLSGGQKTRVALCKLLLLKPDILLLDEPTNHLDIESISWFEEEIKNFKGTIIFVTHDRIFADNLASRIVELDRGKLYSYPGSFNRYIELRDERLRKEELANIEFDRNLAQEEAWIRRGVKARDRKSVV